MSSQPAEQPMGVPRGDVPAGTAGLGARFLARFLDGFLVAVPVTIVLILLGALGGAGWDVESLAAVTQSWAWSAVTGLAWFGYYVFFESKSGATLGKRIMSLRVIDANGQNPDVGAAAKRNIWMLFGLVPIIGGLAQFIAVIVIAVTIASNNFNRGKHDEFAGTAVMV